MPLRHLHRTVAVIAVAASLLVTGCGNADSPKKNDTVAVTGNGTDLAFVDEMIRHHQAAIDMAKIAQTKGEHDEITDLAAGIIETQMNEIEMMRKFGQRLVDQGIRPMPLGMSPSEMGMEMDMTMLGKARPFDKRFIAVMTVHHQGAIAMARTELAKGSSPAVRRVAGGIIRAQQKEVGAMTEWSMTWYGKVPPGMSGGEMGSGA